jgi:hypothetical protein
MSFLAPAFFFFFFALAIPVVIHLIQRERKTIIEFPSLMFLRRIPYQSVRRRRVRHWWLLLMRAAAVAMIVAAFARPFFRQGALASTAGGGARELVILLDQSASMGYGDHWDKARAIGRPPFSGGRRRPSSSRATPRERAPPDRAAEGGGGRGPRRLRRDALRPALKPPRASSADRARCAARRSS